MVVIGVDYASNKYLLDGVDHLMVLNDRWVWMRNLWERWSQETGVQGIHVGYERFGAIADLDYFEERMRTEGVNFEITPLEWPRDGEGSKIDRVQRLTPDLSRHRFYLPYPTDPDRLTSKQREFDESGYGYRISHRIRRRDQDGKIYDVTERLRMQFAFFPFCDKKDLIDATSRIYDLEVRPPVYVDSSTLEPEYL
jgi:hypothetical protein